MSRYLKTQERGCPTSTGLVTLSALLLGAASTMDGFAGYVNGQLSHALSILRGLSLSLLIFLFPTLLTYLLPMRRVEPEAIFPTGTLFLALVYG